MIKNENLSDALFNNIEKTSELLGTFIDNYLSANASLYITLIQATIDNNENGLFPENNIERERIVKKLTDILVSNIYIPLIVPIKEKTEE